MRKIQDFETFKNFYLKTFSYINNYEEERKEKLLNQEFKENIMLLTDDDFIILLDKKPKISTYFKLLVYFILYISAKK